MLPLGRQQEQLHGLLKSVFRPLPPDFLWCFLALEKPPPLLLLLPVHWLDPTLELCLLLLFERIIEQKPLIGPQMDT